MTTELLKNCPFCGSADVALSELTDDDGALYFTVSCEACMGRCGEWYEPCSRSRDAVVAAWNTRIDQAPAVTPGTPQTTIEGQTLDKIAAALRGISFLAGELQKLEPNGPAGELGTEILDMVSDWTGTPRAPERDMVGDLLARLDTLADAQRTSVLRSLYWALDAVG